MKILLSNDDGIYAEGLNVLAHELKSMTGSMLTVVAPDRNRSGASNSLTLDLPLRVSHPDPDRYIVEGTPTDCVHLALSGLLDETLDIVVSGINHGANLGDDVLYSGTVAAATEGRFLGLPAMAVSLVTEQEASVDHFATAAKVVVRMIEQLLKDPLPRDTILNINVPNVPMEALEGYEITRLGTRHQAEPTIVQKDPRGRTVYWVGPPGEEQDAGPGTDFHAVARQRVSVTPLRVDATRYESFDQLSKWVVALN